MKKIIDFLKHADFDDKLVIYFGLGALMTLGGAFMIGWVLAGAVIMFFGLVFIMAAASMDQDERKGKIE
jgi:amino acid transporter